MCSANQGDSYEGSRSALALGSGVKHSVALFDIYTNSTTFNKKISHSGKVRVCMVRVLFIFPSL